MRCIRKAKVQLVVLQLQSYYIDVTRFIEVSEINAVRNLTRLLSQVRALHSENLGRRSGGISQSVAKFIDQKQFTPSRKTEAYGIAMAPHREDRYSLLLPRVASMSDESFTALARQLGVMPTIPNAQIQRLCATAERWNKESVKEGSCLRSREECIVRACDLIAETFDDHDHREHVADVLARVKENTALVKRGLHLRKYVAASYLATSALIPQSAHLGTESRKSSEAIVKLAPIAPENANFSLNISKPNKAGLSKGGGGQSIMQSSVLSGPTEAVVLQGQRSKRVSIVSPDDPLVRHQSNVSQASEKNGYLFPIFCSPSSRTERSPSERPSTNSSMRSIPMRSTHN